MRATKVITIKRLRDIQRDGFEDKVNLEALTHATQLPVTYRKHKELLV